MMTVKQSALAASLLAVCFVGAVSQEAIAQDDASGCIEVKIGTCPGVVAIGRRVHVGGAVHNCGSETTNVHLRLVLVSPDGERLAVGRERAHLEPDQTKRKVVAGQVPEDAQPGRYTLLLVGVTRDGAKDIARKKVLVVPFAADE